VNPRQQFNPQSNRHSDAQNRLNDSQLPPSLNINLGSFDIWWQGVFANHEVMAAQASELMRAHRQNGRSKESYVNRVH
jgi:hypothetical protein